MKILISLFLSIMLISCHKEEEINCDNYTKTYGPYFLEPSSKNLFPYPAGIQRLVFIDTNHHEFNFELDSMFDGIEEVRFRDSCPFDSTRSIYYQQEREEVMMRFYNDSLKLSLLVSISIFAQIKDQVITELSDRFYVHIAIIDPAPHTFYESGIAKVLSQKIGFVDFPEIISLPTWTLFDNTYLNVGYIPKQPYYQWIIYYNNDFGVVGFEHKSGSPKLVLEKIE